MIRKTIIAMTLLACALTAQAGTYAYLTFETTDGSRVSVPVASLTLTVSGTTLMAGTQTFTLTNLSRMYFSTTDESATTAIGAVEAVWKEAAEIFDLAGRKVSVKKIMNSKQSHGVYVVKAKDGTCKLVRK